MCEMILSQYVLINLSKMCSSKEGSVKDLQELAARIFVKGKIETQATNAEADSKKKQPNKELNSNANMSPLARFLLSRLVEKLLVSFSSLPLNMAVSWDVKCLRTLYHSFLEIHKEKQVDKPELFV